MRTGRAITERSDDLFVYDGWELRYIVFAMCAVRPAFAVALTTSLGKVMENPFGTLGEKLGDVLGKWTSLAAIGTFLLYLFGYLALRFQLSTYGVVTDLDVFDQRYLLAGDRFVVYVVSTIPHVLVFALLGFGIVYLPFRLLPASLRVRVSAWPTALADMTIGLPLLGSVAALGLIEIIMRKCLIFGHLLFAQTLPQYGWLDDLLLADDANKSLFFSGLVAGVLLTGIICRRSIQLMDSARPLSRMLTVILTFLWAVEILLLPVNYGVLVASPQLPRVEYISLPGRPAGERLWLAWDAKEARVYFALGADGRRTMISVPGNDARIEVVAFDPIFCILFGDDPKNHRCKTGGALP